MRAFAIRKRNNSFADAIICAADAADAKAYVIDADERCELIEIPPDIATAMGISEAHGRYTGVVSKWIIGST
jgi:hypothetical protein